MAKTKTEAAKPKATEPEATEPKAGSALVEAADGTVSAELMALAEEDGPEDQERSAEDILIPRLNILQALSPQVQKQKGEYIPEAEVGMIYDGIQHLYDGEAGVLLVPISYRRAIIEWTKREDGGGFVKDHSLDFDIATQCLRETGPEKFRDVVLDEKGVPGKTHVVMAAEFLCFIVDKATGVFAPAMVSMTVTQMKKAKQWNSIIDTYRAPATGGGTFNPKSYFNAYRLTTVPESNRRGQDYMGWKVARELQTFNLPNGSAIYEAARDFRASVESGEIKVKPAESNADTSEDGGGSGFTPAEDDTKDKM